MRSVLVAVVKQVTLNHYTSECSLGRVYPAGDGLLHMLPSGDPRAPAAPDTGYGSR